ncbi:MAG TPA: HEAT repeat domain-containing protein [Polyangia bacterium]
MFGLALALAAAPASAQPRIDDVEDSLLHDPSYKVRVDAALILGRLREQHAVPALIAAAHDGHPAVRASAVRALGQIGAPAGRDTVVAALHDPVPTVRHMARDAVRSLGGLDDSTPHDPGEPGIRRRSAKLAIEVRPVGDPSHHAGALLKSHMRDFLVEQLRPLGDVSANDNVDEKQATYAVGGVIKHLSVAHGGPDVEVICAVQLVVMRQPGNALFLMTSGEAHVQKSKRTFRPQLQATMELQAVESAVRGASQDLIAQLGH